MCGNGMRPKKSTLREGQWWDEVGSAVVNARSRKILLLGTEMLEYEDELGHTNVILISSFLRWAKHFAQCKELEKARL
jgi:hypothetical protein